MKHKFVILQGVIEENFGQRFYTTNNEPDPTKSDKGETWYKIIGYADTQEEAEIKLFGRVLKKTQNTEVENGTPNE